jgi:hypothetical protein
MPGSRRRGRQTAFPHRTNSAIWAGLRSTGSAPVSSNWRVASGFWIASFSSAESRATAGAGVPAATDSPCQP